MFCLSNSNVENLLPDLDTNPSIVYFDFGFFLIGGLLGLAGKFPPQYMGIVFGGQAFGGIFASVTNVLVILLGVDPPNAAFFCFLVAVLFLGTALVRAHHIFSRILNFLFVIIFFDYFFRLFLKS